METTFRPISKRRIADLHGYVARGIVLFRAALFLVAVGSVAWLLRAITRPLVQPRFEFVWILPAVAFGAALYVVSARWTGGRSFRARVRSDIAGGVAAVHRVVAVDAIEVDEQEDEGPAYFVLTAGGRTILFSGQYLERYKRNGFPWQVFEIIEAPESKVFFGIVPLGDRLEPSARRPPFRWEEFKRFRSKGHQYMILDVEFEALKEGCITPG